MKKKSVFEEIPGVGKSISRDFFDLGYRSIQELKTENPEQMYTKLCALRGQPIDRCVLYVFREAVYFANSADPEPELLKWWNWKDSNLKNIPYNEPRFTHDK